MCLGWIKAALNENYPPHDLSEAKKNYDTHTIQNLI
jgi:hypothetical protein